MAQEGGVKGRHIIKSGLNFHYLRLLVEEEAEIQLSTKGRYSVMAIVEVARQERGAPVCLGEIAKRLDLSLPYLEQLFMKLRRKGLVT